MVADTERIVPLRRANARVSRAGPRRAGGERIDDRVMSAHRHGSSREVGGVGRSLRHVILVDVERVSMSRPLRPLFSDVSVTVASGDRLGVVGINGTGKSTLLSVIAGTRAGDRHGSSRSWSPWPPSIRSRPSSGSVRRGRRWLAGRGGAASPRPGGGDRPVGGPALGWQEKRVSLARRWSPMPTCSCSTADQPSRRRCDRVAGARTRALRAGS